MITTLPIGDRVDAVVFDADNHLIFASNGDGTVSVIRQKSANEYESVGDIMTQKSAKTERLRPEDEASVPVRSGNGSRPRGQRAESAA